MKALYWLKDNWRYVIMGFAALDVVGNAVIKYLEESTGPTDWHGVLLAAGVALFTYLKKAPGDLTQTEAHAHAEKFAARALASIPPAPRETMAPPLDLPEGE